MKVIQLSTGEKMVVISTKNKQIFRINLNMKNNNLIRIDSNSKSQHEKEVNYIEFNPNNNILITLSKSSIILYDINNPSTNFRKISNFALIGKEYINGIIPNISYCFNNYSYFIHGKKCSKIYLLDLKLNEQNKIDNKNFIKNSIFMLDLDKEIFRKVNDKEIKIFQISILQHLYEYLIIGSNKGLIIFKFDSDNKAPLITLSNMPWLDKTKIQNYFFYNYTKENIILEEKIMISYDKKNKILINKSQRKIEDNILDNSKSLINNYELKINYRNNLIACIDKISNIYIIYKIKPDLKNSNPYCISELIKIDSGEALSFEWCIYSNNFAITKQVSNSTSFLLQVYSINDKDKINKIYEIKDLLSHKIFGGHFIGVIVKKHGEYLQVQMKYINSYNYDIIKDAELNFYYWDEENKLNLSIKEEPLNIISSEDLQFMIICFKDKYNIYQLSELTGNLEKINTVYDKVIHGIIYENIIFLYLTEFGTYFQILNKQCTFPFKLFRQSDEVNLYNLKISKKFKENKLFYNKKPKQTKILCINDNLIFTTDYLGNIEISELNHILFKIISLIKKKNLTGITALLSFLDKKLIKYVLLIFEYYFENDEKILRKIFTTEMIQNFELYNYFEFFIKDLGDINPNKLEIILEKELINAIIKNDTKKINELYQLVDKYQLKIATKVARTINKSLYLDSLMNKKRYVESYLFNLTNKINNNQNNENILSMALSQVDNKNI